MSLVGSLEDLGFGDILQIVSLSRKSGLLLLRSEEGEGRIVFRDGLIRAACGKGEADDLRGLLVAGGFISGEEFDRAAEAAAAHGDPVGDVLARSPNFSKERLDSLRRERVERSVLRMFGWKTGEFSFEIRDDIDECDRELLLPTGINSQYLTMEATRLGDEGEGEGDDDIQFGMIDDSEEAEPTEMPTSDAALELPAESSEPDADDTAEFISPEEGRSRIAEALALAAARKADTPADDDESGVDHDVAEAPAEPAPTLDEDLPSTGFAAAPEPFVAKPLEPEPEAAVVAEFKDAADVIAEEVEPTSQERIDATEEFPPSNLTSLVIIDPDLNALEWQKSVLGPICRRIHIFQRADAGISRIRQYLRRGETPFVLVSDNVPGDPMGGISDPVGLIRRLRAHAPHMPIFFVQSGERSNPPRIGETNGLLQRPADHQLASRRAWNKLEAAGGELREALLRAAAAGPPKPPTSRRPAPGASVSNASGDRVTAENLFRLKQMSDRLRDPSVRGEVLSLILEFAAESFSRVAIFMVRDDEAVGMAQSGLARADGPGDEAFREISITAREPAWFHAVLDRREGVRAPPGNEGDRKLAALLGSAVPREAYVAPIESSHRVVALVYADNLPGDAPIGDTISLEIVLHEAGLALERALLERALAEAADRGSV
jgi:hypothetical protein